MENNTAKNTMSCTVEGYQGLDAWIVGRGPKSFTGEVVKFYDNKKTALVKRDSDGKLIECDVGCITMNQGA